MKLYHGTSDKYLARILKEGIKPRSHRKGNWEHTVLSRADAVYLTTAYAPYFAIQAMKRITERICLIEVDTSLLNPFQMAPDEDALAQAAKSEHGEALQGMDCIQRAAWFRDRLGDYCNDYAWRKSVEAIGNCAYLGTVPPGAITRVATFSHKDCKITAAHAINPMISITNYQIVGKHYRGLIKWIFGDDLGADAPVRQFDVEAMEAFKKHAGHDVSALAYDYRLPPDQEREHIKITHMR